MAALKPIVRSNNMEVKRVLSGSNRLLRSTGLVFVSSIAASAFTFLTHVFLARNLTVESYGVVNVLLESLSTVIMFGDMGTTVALINLYVRYKREGNEERVTFLAKTIALIKLAIGLISSAVIVAYLTLTKKLDVENWLIAVGFGCACFEVLYQYFLALYQCREAYLKLAFYRVVLPGFRLAGIAFLIITGSFSLYSAIFLYSIVVVVTLLLMFFGTKNRKDAWASFRTAFYCEQVLADIKSVTRWTSLSSLVVVLLMKMDIFFLLSLSNSTQVGIFSTAQKYAAVGTIISSALSAVLMPRAAHIENSQALRQYVRSSFQVSMLFAAPVFVLIFMAKYLLVQFFGQQYQQSIIIAQWLTFSFAIGLIINPLSYVFYNLGCAKYLTYMNVAQLVLAVCVDLALVPAYGALGPGIANLVTRVLGAAFILWVYFVKITPRVK